MFEDQNFILGTSMLMFGVASFIVFEDQWFIGLPFLLLGAHRVFVAVAAAKSNDSPDNGDDA